MEFNDLTIISHGMGTDTCTIMELFLLDSKKAGKPMHKKYIKGEVLVIFSDLRVEYPETYKWIKRQEEICKKLGWTFIRLTPEMGYHPNLVHSTVMAKSIRDWWYNSFAIASVAGGQQKKICTFRWKISPIWDFVSAMLDQAYFEESYNHASNRKRAITEYGKQSKKKINLIIGFTKGEEKRIDAAKKKEKEDSKNKNAYEAYIKRFFPLKDKGMTRQDCIDFFRETLKKEPPRPSNCMYCHYQSEAEVLHLSRKYPKIFADWKKLEKRKIKDTLEKGKDPEKNYGVKGKYTMTKFLEKAKNKKLKDNDIIILSRKFPKWEKYIGSDVEFVLDDLNDKELYELVLIHGCATNVM